MIAARLEIYRLLPHPVMDLDTQCEADNVESSAS